MTLLHAASLGLAFGSRTVFEGLTLTLDEGERVGLVGVNGSGKSSLMRILARAAEPDCGEVQLRRGASVTYLPQEPTFPDGATVASELEVARAPLRAALAAHEALAVRLAAEPDPQRHERLLAELAAVDDRIHRLGGWDTAHEARRLLDRLGVPDWERQVAELSGGTRKRVAIARALLTHPDLLLLDEPTNHLDADTVDWLEEELDQLSCAILLVTHDRYFLDDLVDRMVEITPGGGVTSHPGNYTLYLESKLEAEALAGLAEHKRQRWIAQEVAWLRKGVEARRTKSKARVQRARALLAQRGPARPQVPELQVAAPPRLSQVVLEAHGLHKSFGGAPVLRDVSFRLQRGERVGIVGPNGVGKTTFLRVLLGELVPDAGSVVVGQRTRVAYHDQARASLDPAATVYEAAGGSAPGAGAGEDLVTLGERRVALRDYLDDLLFPPPMQRLRVEALSGGERNRLLLARLFLEGANVLVLDEPTNDLDLVTLGVLERLLLAFPGSVLLVTHDRWFLDKVATGILAFEGGGRAVRYPGNYETYRTLKDQAERAALESAGPDDGRRAPSPTAGKGSGRGALGNDEPEGAEPAARRAGRLSFKEQRELDGMEAALLAAEARQAELEAALSDPATYQRQGNRVGALRGEHDAAAAEVARLYARWQELELERARGGH